MVPPLMPQGTPNARAIYLTQWLKVASGGRVYLAQKGAFGVNSFYVFRCSACQDNWHVGAENFVKYESVPQVLIDWVKKHRHVCTKYTNTHGVTAGTCSMCGWPYGAHEASWIDDTGISKIGAGSLVIGNGTVGDEGVPPPKKWDVWEPKTKLQPLPIFKGRRFRDATD